MKVLISSSKENFSKNIPVVCLNVMILTWYATDLLQLIFNFKNKRMLIWKMQEEKIESEGKKFSWEFLFVCLRQVLAR
jgi:hypothetical protein